MAGHTRQKRDGIHYTPPELARFVAERTASLLPDGPVRVLDPACGDGELLLAISAVLGERGREFELCGLDADEQAVRTATARLSHLPATLRTCDFLDHIDEKFDAVIANPPYVRTQVLGGPQARRLAAAFGLTGRLDLYQAFIAEITTVLREGGALGLISSNRFLTVRSGAAVRSLLVHSYEIDQIVDLGDTKLFRAAVLPALVFARRSGDGSARIPLVSIYRAASTGDIAGTFGSVTDALRAASPGLHRIGDSDYRIVSGTVPGDVSLPWAADRDGAGWLRRVEERTWRRFGDVGPVRVGVKTTADPVFVRRDWGELGAECPEEELLLPLLTHHGVRRWRAVAPASRILYPYDLSQHRRTPLPLHEWPRTLAYLERHRSRLEARRYVVEGGRDWWEIWVPQRPAEWSAPKLVFPDISQAPCFYMDESGAVVNGDSYWIPLAPGCRELGLLMLGVANSTFATRFYDSRCGNRLYSGRRRFITQYVAEFPLPDPATPEARRIVELVAVLLENPDPAAEAEADRLVWAAFGHSP